MNKITGENRTRLVGFCLFRNVALQIGNLLNFSDYFWNFADSTPGQWDKEMAAWEHQV